MKIETVESLSARTPIVCVARKSGRKRAQPFKKRGDACSGLGRMAEVDSGLEEAAAPKTAQQRQQRNSSASGVACMQSMLVAASKARLSL